MTTVYLSLGGNQGDVCHHIDSAIQKINNKVGHVVSVSSYYETEPWGFEAETNFVNCVLKVSTSLSAKEVLKEVLEIEALLGRRRVGKGYASRPMDIDLIDFDGMIMEDIDLILPHPRMHQRNFVLMPLKDVAPDWVHPRLNKGMDELIGECVDEGEIKKMRR